METRIQFLLLSWITSFLSLESWGSFSLHICWSLSSCAQGPDDQPVPTCKASSFDSVLLYRRPQLLLGPTEDPCLSFLNIPNTLSHPPVCGQHLFTLHSCSVYMLPPQTELSWPSSIASSPPNFPAQYTGFFLHNMTIFCHLFICCSFSVSSIWL